MTDQLSIEERVANGVRWLDEHEPGWSDDMNLERLDLSDCKACVLGQLYGSYIYAPNDALSYDDEDDAEAGIDRGFYEPSGNYALLDQAWRAAITARRSTQDGAAP